MTLQYQYNPHTPTQLCEIMGRNKSDKGHSNINNSWHNYTTFYYSIFNTIRNDKLRIFELGLGTNNVALPSNMGASGRPGASLYGWTEFFPNARIFGADIDTDILFKTDRISTYYCDQTSPSAINEMWSIPELAEGFDIIIEDGLHTYSANVCFFENSIHKLNKGGYYIIEDIKNSEFNLFTPKLKEWGSQYPHLIFNLIQLPLPRNNFDNSLIVIHYPKE